MSADAEATLARLRSELEAGRVHYFGIRHHSPVCARAIRDWIRAHRPDAVLVEGPADAASLIELLIDEEARAPLAVYSTVSLAEGQPRAAAYYPLCDYSPELVALREGRAVGAALHFIDLPYASQLTAERPLAHFGPRSLVDEGHLARSRYVSALVAQHGCRDLHELWDHLFEEGGRELDPDALRWRVAAWCALARLDYGQEALEADGTVARERAMARHIRAALGAHEGVVLVVTGGFHTVALPALVAAPADGPPDPSPVGASEHYLIPYGFAQLDALGGYTAGMPAPGFYQRGWDRDGTAADPMASAAELLVEIGRRTRAAGLGWSASPADELAALTQAGNLARLRGHRRPTREDLLDAIRSCFVKGPRGGAGALFELAHDVLAGDAVGACPARAGAPPLVVDFRRRVREAGLEPRKTGRRELTLDVYRKPKHRVTSRLLHALGLLRAPLATLIDGPDFVLGIGLGRLHERWMIDWTPSVEAALIDLAHTGATLAEACGHALRRVLVEAEERGQGRSLALAARVLAEACRVGLSEQLGPLSEQVAAALVEDGAIPSLVAGLGQLDRLAQAPVILEAKRVAGLGDLREAAYRRTCLELRQVAGLSDDAASAAVAAIVELRGIVSGAPEVFDAELLDASMAAIATDARVPSRLRGGAWGVRFSSGHVDEAALAAAVRGEVGGTHVDPAARVAFVRGLLAAARDVAWRLPGFLESLDRLFASWDEEAFLRALPELRLAFAELTPREIDRVADAVGELGGEALGELVLTDVDEHELPFNARVQLVAREALAADGLGGAR